MKAITKVFKDLMVPDDQAQSWYFWACNQMAHALLGVVVALVAGPYWVASVIVLAALKEFFDLMGRWSKKAVIDSGNDILFWVCGAGIYADTDFRYAYLFIMFIALSYGVYCRVKNTTK